MQTKIKKAFSNNKKQFTMFLVLVGMFIICSFLSPVFLSASNLLNLLQQNSVIGIMSIGMVILLLTGAIDLSVGSTLALTGVLTSYALKSFGLVLGILIGLSIGTIIGLINGILTTKVKINYFVTTLGNLTFIRGVVYIITGGTPVRGLPREYGVIGMGRIGGVFPISAVIWLVLLIIMYIVIRKTRFGQYLYAIGGNENAAWLSGVNIDKIKILAFVLCGLFASIGGIIHLLRVLLATADAGDGYELQVIASCIVGGISLEGGRGSILGSIVGVFILGIILNILQLTGVSSFYQSAITGLIIIVAVGIDSVSSKKRE